jgi:RimJ/RimL family protein N-acetyltransferase
MDDLDAMCSIQSQLDVTRYLYWEPRDRTETREWLAQRVSQRKFDPAGDVVTMAVERQDSGVVIGWSSLHWASVTHSQGELGYVLDPAHHGRGFATEVAVALLGLGFEGLALHRVYGRCDGRNAASARVMERAGMRREAHLRENEFVKGEWTDELVYAMLAAEWSAR